MTGRKDGKLYLYNGMLLLFLFFVSRVVLYGAGLLHLATLRQARLCVLAHLASPAQAAHKLLASLNLSTHDYAPIIPAAGTCGRGPRPTQTTSGWWQLLWRATF